MRLLSPSASSFSSPAAAKEEEGVVVGEGESEVELPPLPLLVETRMARDAGRLECYIHLAAFYG